MSLDFLYYIIPVVLAITLHEAAHGFVAERFGDDTARRAGRVTLNPFKHVDRFGTIVLPGLLYLLKSPFIIGYAKPVPVDFPRLRPQRAGVISVAFAGPATNMILAYLSALLLHLDAFVKPEEAEWLFRSLYISITINCLLAALNLLPILPLDGGRILGAMLPRKIAMQYHRTEKYGFLLLILILAMPSLGLPNVAEWLILFPAFALQKVIMAVAGIG